MKKKFIVSLIAVVLALALCFPLAGCNKNKQKDSSPVTDVIDVDTEHGGKAEKTDSLMIEDGKSDYSIICKTDDTESNKAAAAFQRYFFEAAGILLPIGNDAQATENGKYISVGNTSLAESAGVSYAESSTSGFKIKTVGDDIFLVGGKYGIVYSAYELLGYLFDFDYYAPNTYSLNKGVTELSLYDFDVLEIPDIETRMPYATGTAFLNTDPNMVDAMYLNRQDIMKGYSSTLHNSFAHVLWKALDGTDASKLSNEKKTELELKFISEHRNWFSPKENAKTGYPYQLCFTRAVDEYRPLIVEKMKEAVTENPSVDVFTFVHEDNTFWCDCDSCLALERQYGAASAGYVKLMNSLTAEIHEWAETELNRDIKLCAMAYHANQDAPVTYDAAKDEYSPVDDSVVFDKNLYLYLTTAGAFSYRAFDDRTNERIIGQFKAWSTLADKICMYTYNQWVYPNYFVFYDDFDAMQRNYQLMTKYNAAYILDLGQYNNLNSTAFNALRLYLTSKLAWNCKADIAYLTDKYFTHCYGDAAKPMRELFEAVRGRYAVKVADGTLTQATRTKTCSAEMWPEGLVDSLNGYIDQAYAAIEPLKASDETAYNAIREAICLESLSYRYLRLHLYGGNYTASELKTERLLFKQDCTRLKITRSGEWETIETLWNNWGI